MTTALGNTPKMEPGMIPKEETLTPSPKKRGSKMIQGFLPPELNQKRGNIQWNLYGVYKSDMEVKAIARQNKVSRRKTDELLSGSKVTYRCNAWKRTRCPFQMYALTMADNQIYVYKGGEHHHGGLRIPGINTIPVPQNFDDLQHKLLNGFAPEDSQAGPSSQGATATVKIEENYDYQNFMNPQFLLPNFMNNMNNMVPHMNPVPQQMMQQNIQPVPSNIFDGIVPKEEVTGPSSNSGQGPSQIQNPSVHQPSSRAPTKGGRFRLIDRKNELLQMAEEYSLGFIFNVGQSGTAEITFTNKDQVITILILIFSQNKSLVLSDFETKIVVDVIGPESIKQTWKKTEWEAFSWQIRGMVLHFLKNVGAPSR